MTWTAERTTVNQKVQIGAESTSALGTPVAAGKTLECFDWTFAINADVQFYRATGRKYNSEQEENTEWVDLTVAGNMDYNGLIYLLNGVYGSVAATGHGSSSTAKDWIWTPPVTGSVVPQTYTVQQGDSVRAHQVAYTLFNSWGYKVTRKSNSISGKGIGQPLSDGITLTSSPSVIALAPIASKHFNMYLDTTSGGLGTTQILRPLSIDYLFDAVYGPLYVLNRANLGYTAHVDLAPKSTIKLKFEANAEGMAPLSYLQSGTTYYLRVDAQGPQIASDGPGAVKNEFKHDMAIKFNKPTAFADDSGVFAIEWECDIVEDSAWGSGQAQQLTLTNLITAV